MQGMCNFRYVPAVVLRTRLAESSLCGAHYTCSFTIGLSRQCGATPIGLTCELIASSHMGSK
eukprot:365721-Chlamydomonas_euryale.AAC.11